MEKLDVLGQEINIGDYVVYAPAGAYSGVSIGIIEKFTPKNFGIKCLFGGEGRHIGGYYLNENHLYYTTSVVKIDSELAKKKL